MIEINNPIFIIGSGRSGTSILYKLLSIHPEVCWFSNYTDKFPRLDFLSIIHRIIDIPLIGYFLKKQILKKNPAKIAIKPVEAQHIYHDYCNFEYRLKTTEKDFNKMDSDRFKNAISAHLKYTKKKRFISKQTANNQRLHLINKIFPDAYYIHIIRDRRAVAASLTNVNWWLNTELWWAGKRVKDLMCDIGKNRLEVAALHWKTEIEEIFEFKNKVKNRFFEVKYEDLCSSTKKMISEMISFCRLEDNSPFFDMIPDILQNQNYKSEWLSHADKKSILTE